MNNLKNIIELNDINLSEVNAGAPSGNKRTEQIIDFVACAWMLTLLEDNILTLNDARDVFNAVADNLTKEEFVNAWKTFKLSSDSNSCNK